MNSEILFSETQKFNQWWLWLILLSSSSILIVVIIIIVGRQDLIDKSIRNIIVILAGLLVILPALLFVNLRLETQIRQDGVYVRFFPFHLSFKQYKWDKISKSFVRKYSPIGEYGGWGFRFGASGDALNVSGDKGLQLEFSD